MDDRLYRSRHERMISGVAGGLAERLDVDPSIVRVIWVLLVLPTGFLALLAYVVMAIVVPEEPPVGGPVAETAAAAAAAGEGAGEAPTAPAWPDARAQRRSEREARRAARRAEGGNAAIILGGILVVVGALFLARQFLPELDFDLLWPIALMVIGVALVLGSVRRA